MTNEPTVTVPVSLLVELMNAVSETRRTTLNRAEDCLDRRGRSRPGKRGLRTLLLQDADACHRLLARALIVADRKITSDVVAQIGAATVRTFAVRAFEVAEPQEVK